MSIKDFKILPLYELYSPLLTEKKQNIFELSYYDDLTLSEIAEHTGTTRQGVREMLARTCDELKEYEEKLQLYQSQRESDEVFAKIRALAEKLEGSNIKDEILKITAVKE